MYIQFISTCTSARQKTTALSVSDYSSKASHPHFILYNMVFSVQHTISSTKDIKDKRIRPGRYDVVVYRNYRLRRGISSSSLSTSGASLVNEGEPPIKPQHPTRDG